LNERGEKVDTEQRSEQKRFKQKAGFIGTRGKTKREKPKKGHNAKKRKETGSPQRNVRFSEMMTGKRTKQAGRSLRLGSLKKARRNAPRKGPQKKN